MLKTLFLAVLAANILLLVSSTVTSSSSSAASSSSSSSSSSFASSSSSSSAKEYEGDDDDNETIDDDDESTPTCGLNEVYSECTQAECRNQDCTQKGKPVACPGITAGSCEKGCVCQENYLRAKNGTCIPENQCPEEPTSCNGDPNAIPGCGVNCGRLCSNYDSPDPVPCILICYLDACDCKKDYVFDSNTGKCVLPTECTPQCKVNEVFSNCTQAECRATSCKDRNRPIACPIIAAGSCEKGCLCQENYYRADNGTCIPESECDGSTPQCNVNEVFSNCTQADCRATSCKDRNRPIACPILAEGSCEKGCLCQENYYRADNGTCIPESECDDPTPQCNVNEVFSNCTQAECRATSCKDRNRPIACPIIAEGSCEKGCLCQENYYRADNGNCIPESECDGSTPQCNVNEVFSNCTQADCRATSCKDRNRPIACPIIAEGSCEKGCLCQENYYRADNGNCIPESECDGSTPQCNVNEVFSNCTQAECRATSCKDRNKPIACPIIAEGSCEKGCLCQENYYRADNGTCIPESECDGSTPQCNVNEVFSNCTQAECRATSCKDRNRPIACPIIAEGSCEKGCLCQENYYRADNGTCIPESECDGSTSQCNVNEVFSNCTQADCRATSCKDRNRPIACPIIAEGSCEKGCLCQENYYRADNGTCIPESECDDPKEPTSCNGDPNAIPGCGVNCGRLCSNYDSPDPVACILICYLDACDCKKDYVFDSNTGKCVLPTECTPQCKVNEVFSNCTQAECRATSCKDRNRPIACPIIAAGSCEKGCLCQENYYRADNGTCIPESECDGPTPQCKVNEVFSNCTQADCRATSCKDRNRPIACPIIAEGSCEKGCLCQENYYRANNGTCIPESECDRAICPGGGQYNTCPAAKCDAEYCPKDRNSPQSCRSTRNCGKPRCTCGFNQKRNRKTGKCVAIADCPPFKCDGPNEAYQACPPACPGQKCSDYINNSTCPKFGEIGITVPCQPQCRCKENYYRNSKGICVQGSQCKKEGPVSAVASSFSSVNTS